MSHLRRMNDTWSQMGEMGSNLLQAEFQGLWLIPLLALPNAIYIWLWILPGAWINTTKRATPIFGGSWPSDKTSQGDKACQYLAVLAHTIKMIQAACVVAWFRLYSPDSLTVSSVLAQPAWRLVLGVAGVAFGQCLNVAIYAAIGRNGVYYGSRLGAPLGPWCSGFPFNIPVVGRHPQYTGALLSLWGGVLLTSDDSATAAGFPTIAVLWTIIYIITGIVENTEGHGIVSDHPLRPDGPAAKKAARREKAA